MEITELHKALDNIIGKYSVEITTYLGVLNEEKERERLKEDKYNYTPKFEYPPLDFDPAMNVAELKRIKDKYRSLSNMDELLELQIKKIDELIALHSMLYYRDNNPEEFFTLSLKVYGRPEEKDVKKAEKFIISTDGVKEEEKNLSSEYLKKEIENTLKKYNLDLKGWKIDEREASVINVDPAKKTIQIPSPRIGRRFSKREIKKLIAHEIFTHVFRKMNGELQKLSNLFGLGFPYYLQTEEGLACYMEEMYNANSIENERMRAAYVLAVDMLCNNYSFFEIYETLTGLGLNKSKAFKVCMRVFRGGGFTKDACYFSGKIKVKDYIKSNTHALKTLYVGKISLDHIEFCERMLSDGGLKEPTYLPYKIR